MFYRSKTIGKSTLRLVLTTLIMMQGLMLSLYADVAQAPSHTQVYAVNSGIYNGNGQSEIIAYTAQVQVTSAEWLRINFSSIYLGNESYIIIKSNIDDAEQRLNSQSIIDWQNTSAYFNGNSVEITLHVAANDIGVYFTIDNIIMGDINIPAGVQSQCGTTDDRVGSTNPRIGRLAKIGCTAWLIPTGNLVTAGHCLSTSNLNDIVEFNVPYSSSVGTIRHPHPRDQYAVDENSIVYNANGMGDDWGMFQVFPNSNTGLLPIDAQGASFTVVQNLQLSTIRITGYGRDEGVLNQTQQTSTGPYGGSTGTRIMYQTDTEGGNSGSPIIDESTGYAVGVHTNGGCEINGPGNNSGTSSFNSSFWSAINLSVQVTIKNEFKDPNNAVLNGGLVNVDHLDKSTDPQSGVYTRVFAPNSSHRFKAISQTVGNYYREFNNLQDHDGGWVYPDGVTKKYFSEIKPNVQGGTYTAKYLNRYNVNMTSASFIEEGSGGTYKVNNINVGTTWSGNIMQYQSKTIEAVPPSGYSFIQWSDGNTDNPRIITPTDNTSLYAVYKVHLASSTSSATAGSNQRKIVTNGNTKYLVYVSAGNVWFTTYNGSTWSQEFEVSNSTTAKNPSISVYSPNTVNIAWEEGSPTELHHAMYRQLNLQNQTWSNIIDLSGTQYLADGDASPVVGSQGYSGTALVIWTSQSGLVVRYDPLNTSLSPHYLYQDPLGGHLSSPSLSDDSYGDERASVFLNPDNSVVYQEFTVNTSGVPTILTTTMLSDENSICANPNIVKTRYWVGQQQFDNKVVTWDAQTTSGNRVFARQWNSGTGWATISQLSHNNHAGANATVGYDENGKISILWECGTHLARTTRLLNTTTWGTVTDLGTGYGPSVSLTGSNLAGTWIQGSSSPYTLNFYTLSAPSAPTLSSPANGATGVSISATLTWSASYDAESYHLQVDNENTFAAPLVSDQGTVTGTSGNVSGLANNTTYYWRVKATNSSGDGSYSSVRSFTTALPPPATPGNFHLAGTTWGCGEGGGEEFMLPGGGEESMLLIGGDDGSGGEMNSIIPPSCTEYTKLLWNQCTETNGIRIEIYRGTTTTNLTLHDTTSYSSTSYTDCEACYGGMPQSYYYQIRAVSTSGTSGFTSMLNNGYSKRDAGSQTSSNAPQYFGLDQNTPNPFNPTTTISYQLPYDSYVTLKVYNTLGKEVALLVNEMQDAGYKYVTFDANSLPSGVYFYHIMAAPSAGSGQPFSDIKKMMLVK